ncbi:MAG: TIM44-like domain-containing protein [Xanthobacteraceae bacterium]
MFRLCHRPLLALAAAAAALLLVVGDADARAGRGGSFGSRGSQTYSAPPSTATAPGATRPMERSMTQPGQSGGLAQRPATTSPGGGWLGRPGFMGGLFAGFLGAGLLGMLFGHGLFGGLGGFASMLGLLLQVGIVAVIGYMLWTWWQRRNQPALASGPALRSTYPGYGERSQPSFASGGGGGSVEPRTAGTDGVGLTPEDFNTFEHILGDVQSAYGAEDLNRLRARATPEMVSYFAEDLAANSSKGVVNKISDVKLLQGDLAEAWREGDTDYATVAMRYSLADQIVERDSGRVVESGANEATEVWSFMRKRGGHWLLAAIQQAA